VEHIPDVGLNDIKEEDEEEIEEQIESDDEFDEEDAPKVLNLSQDGVASEDTDFEPFSKSRNYLIVPISTSACTATTKMLSES